ncbi:MAG: ImmA/IrrE family metallo-endopeptidase [Acidobacteria bacterium]|nr:ImmA/IrrE family metallo-endopeptidase [Acidobacteriota bacterium]
MRTLEEKGRSLRVGWGKRPLTEGDFERLCRRFRVTVTEMPLNSGGFYYRVKGRDHIAIDSRLSGVAKLKVQFHELAHFLLHAPEGGATANFLRVGQKTRVEYEADAFALCAIVPRRWLEERTVEEILAAEDITPDVLTERLGIYLTYGI